MYEPEDFPIGAVVLTPSGRRAIVKRHLTGASKKDCFARLICHYEGSGTKDLVTLQPHQLRLVETDFCKSQMSSERVADGHTYSYEKEQKMALIIA